MFPCQSLCLVIVSPGKIFRGILWFCKNSAAAAAEIWRDCNSSNSIHWIFLIFGVQQHITIDHKMTEGISDWTLRGSGGPKSQNMDILHRGRRDRNKSTNFWYMFLIFGMWGHIDMEHKMTEGNLDWPLGRARGGVTKFNISKYCHLLTNSKRP